MKSLQSGFAIACDSDVIAMRGQAPAQNARQLRLVIDNQNALLSFHGRPPFQKLRLECQTVRASWFSLVLFRGSFIRDKSGMIHDVTRKRNPRELNTNLVAGGKFDHELCAGVSGGVLDPDAASMRFDNAAGDCQPHSASGL